MMRASYLRRGRLSPFLDSGSFEDDTGEEVSEK